MLCLFLSLSCYPLQVSVQCFPLTSSCCWRTWKKLFLLSDTTLDSVISSWALAFFLLLFSPCRCKLQLCILPVKPEVIIACSVRQVLCPIRLTCSTMALPASRLLKGCSWKATVSHGSLNSSKQIHRGYCWLTSEYLKVCSLKVHCGNSAEIFSCCSKSFELHYFIITVAKAATYHHLSHKVFPILKQNREGTLCSWLSQYLWQEILVGVLFPLGELICIFSKANCENQWIFCV